jgi:uncharacterized protein YciI
MKKSLTYIILLFICLMNLQKIHSQDVNNTANAQYDSILASRLGADQYGMKQYYMVFLYRGSTAGLDSVERMKIQAGHIKNIQRLARENKMIMAGPFLDNQELRGIFVINAGSQKEVEELVKTDPAVKAGVLKTEIRPWYGSAALMQMDRIHRTIQKPSNTD